MRHSSPSRAPAVAMLAASVTIVAGVTMCAPPSRGQEIVICFPAKSLDAAMLMHSNQRPIGTGVLDEKHVLRIYVGEDGEFSIFRISAIGVACLVGAGSDWEPEPLGQPS